MAKHANACKYSTIWLRAEAREHLCQTFGCSDYYYFPLPATASAGPLPAPLGGAGAGRGGPHGTLPHWGCQGHTARCDTWVGESAGSATSPTSAAPSAYS